MNQAGVWSLLAAGLVACGAARADAVSEVRCAETAFSLAAEARDSERFLSFIDDEARFAGSAVQRGHAEIAAAWAPFFEADGASIAWRPEVVEVLPGETLALSRGPYRLRLPQDDGTVREAWGIYNSTWRRSADGRWRVVFDAGCAPAGEPTEAMRALLEAPLPDCDSGVGPWQVIEKTKE